MVTDVGSVKSGPLRRGARTSPGVERYVGGHPMAGSERSGPLAASAGAVRRPPVGGHPARARPTPGAVDARRGAGRGSAAPSPVRLSPEEHDRAVARTSHLPHLLAALVAGRLADAPADHLALSGQGVRDVTRVAAGDPALYGQIVDGQRRRGAGPARRGPGPARRAHRRPSDAARPAPRSRRCSSEGVAGTRAIPGKHGGPVRPTRSVFVSVPDHPGELARLFADAGESGVNIEDVRIDHDPGRPVGLVELVVDEEPRRAPADALWKPGVG